MVAGAGGPLTSVATTTGLGVAAGATGACVLAAAGAFVVRKRLRLKPADVLLDESEPDPTPAADEAGTD